MSKSMLNDLMTIDKIHDEEFVSFVVYVVCTQIENELVDGLIHGPNSSFEKTTLMSHSMSSKMLKLF